MAEGTARTTPGSWEPRSPASPSLLREGRGQKQQRVETLQTERRTWVFTLNEMKSYLKSVEQRKDVV